MQSQEIKLLGYGILGMGIAKLLHELIRISPMFIPASLGISGLGLFVLAVMCLILFVKPEIYTARGKDPYGVLAFTVVLLLSFLFGIIFAWVN
ncbi:MAG TPA: hypothetical protein V6D19_00500 [Stenomitos sp.]